MDRTEYRIKIHNFSQMYIFYKTSSATDRMRQKNIKDRGSFIAGDEQPQDAWRSVGSIVSIVVTMSGATL